MQQLNAMIERFPNRAKPHHTLVVCLITQGKMVEAQTAASRMRSSFPNEIQLTNLSQGILHRWQPSCVDHLERAVEHTPTHAAGDPYLFDYYVYVTYEYAKALGVANRSLRPCHKSDDIVDMYEK